MAMTFQLERAETLGSCGPSLVGLLETPPLCNWHMKICKWPSCKSANFIFAMGVIIADNHQILSILWHTKWKVVGKLSKHYQHYGLSVIFKSPVRALCAIIVSASQGWPPKMEMPKSLYLKLFIFGYLRKLRQVFFWYDAVYNWNTTCENSIM